jgi:signal transduction histidine kinase
MEAQDKQEEGIPRSEVMSALLDLARISHHVESAASENTGAIATMLLERLLVLCKAKRGAILFTAQPLVEANQAFEFPPTGRKMFRRFALHGMNEEEAYVLAATYSAKGAAIQSPPGEPCWVICRLPISAAQLGEQVSLAQQKNNSEEWGPAGGGPARGIDRRSASFAEIRAPQAPLWRARSPLYALLVLGWDGNDEQMCIEATKHGKDLLPYVTDVAGSALMNVLLAERIHELEALADHKALHEMELFKAELLATVSHELRSPLASVKGYAATLLRHERRISREERHEFLLAIAQASDRLEAVIDRLLEISQLETGSITIQRSPVDLAYLIREAINSVEQHLEVPGGQSRYTFTLSLQDHLGMPTQDGPLIQADRSRLREVLDNLIENAIKYSPGGGTIEVVVRPLVASSQASKSQLPPGKSDHDKKMGNYPSSSRPRQMVEICVRDEGIGISASHLERIFDRFYRVDTRLTREVNGIGLGLAICKQIVELHEGMIWVESEIGAGSEFHVLLPVDERT